MSGVRSFRKVGGVNINYRVRSVQFFRGGARSMLVAGGSSSGANWTLREAESLVESGNWEEFDDSVGAPHAPETVAGEVW